MATTAEPTYIWELGIDSELLPAIANASYMPGAFVLTATNSLQRPFVSFQQTISFRIFDLSKGNVTKLESFTINPQISVSSGNINPLEHLQPGVKALGSQSSVFFGDSFPCWGTDPVAITAQPASPEQRLKFLLNFYVQATVTVNQIATLRLFAHDPEMIVGPHM